MKADYDFLARDMMLEATDAEHALWYLVHSGDKRRAFRSSIPYQALPRSKVEFPKQSGPSDG
ncbi:MAG: hypothetical protein ACREX9_14715 [Gammaproteobacteria bacterium]